MLTQQAECKGSGSSQAHRDMESKNTAHGETEQSHCCTQLTHLIYHPMEDVYTGIIRS